MKILDNIGFMVGEIRCFLPKEVFDLCNRDFVLLDIREDYINYIKLFAVKNVIQIPLSDLKNQLEILNKEAKYIVGDSSGNKTKDGIKILKEYGFSNVFNLAGGIIEWERDGMPISVDEFEQLQGACMCQLKPRKRKK